MIFACARSLAEQPVFIINTMMQNTDISELVFNSRSVFVVVGTILEGERDYGEQTLATPTLQRLHFLRGVANMILVSVKVQGVKSTFCWLKTQQLFIHSPEAHLHTTNKSQIVYFIVL